uniref:Uncharacterized protein n=1 Tax=Panagrolaimus sp. JU765 TaxID=591449 RepID=A0AC34QF53_9BILA
MVDFRLDVGGCLKDVVEWIPDNVDIFNLDACSTSEPTFNENLTFFYVRAKSRPTERRLFFFVEELCSVDEHQRVFDRHHGLHVRPGHRQLDEMRFQGPLVGEYQEKPGSNGIKKYYVWSGKIARGRVQVAFSVE